MSKARSNGGDHLNGGRRRFRFWALLTALLALAGEASELERISALAREGAPELAVELLDRGQPEYRVDADEWMRWERRRLELLAAAEAWENLLTRVEALPETLPDPFLHWAAEQRAEGLLALGQGAAARRVAGQLLWGTPAAPVEVQARWRRLVIRSYLDEGLGEEASIAVLRYRQDFGGRNGEFRLLTARALLNQGRAEAAVGVLADLEGAGASALRLLAALRAGTQTPRAVQRRANDAARQLTGTAPAPVYWAIVAEAAELAGDVAARVQALEALFAVRGEHPVIASVFGFTPDTLWDAYAAYAQRVGNREGLLIGDVEVWEALAETDPRMYPIRQRSIYALLVLRGDGNGTHFHQRFISALTGDERSGPVLLRQLYFSSARFADSATIPPAVRWQLLDLAIADGDLELASRLVRDLGTEGEGHDFMARLRQARVLIMAGDHEQGAALLAPLTERAATLTPEQVARLIQVLFDLQTVDRHATALPLFQALFERVADPRQRRELLYWMADSSRALDQPLEAARLYLESATVPGPGSMDPWAQTARYHAAGALADAGLYQDAARVLRDLLRVTTDIERQGVLRRDLEQLWLRQGKR